MTEPRLGLPLRRIGALMRPPSLFLVFVITKPRPARAFERRINGGLGIMLDDIPAEFYAVRIILIGEGVFGVRP